ncbi:unnamed protein product [Heligmosomoides polygyrus]|uniref:Peptidase A2 domain-containing protein n=1 Tax=Heligmosomoides polygyrus TaxID=6339 RepID=A0A183GJD0_HELPZ|nr:unnamed protein product [Heligmosomoides polygyrus]
MADREALQVLCDISDCERSDLVQRVREMKREVDDRVRELTDQLRDLGRSRSQPTTNASANTSHAQGTVDFSQCDPHMLIVIANKMLREQNRQQVFCGHSSEELEKTKGLFGPKSMTSIRMIEMEVKASLDTGSEMSIIPVKVLQKARREGIDLDIHVTKILRIDTVVRNASGEIMTFLDTVCVPVTMR